MKLRHLIVIVLAALLGLSIRTVRAQNSVDRVVLVEATVTKSPARIVLHWPKDTLTTSMSVYRRSPDATSWGALRRPTLVKDSFFVDTTVVVGTEYEYRLMKSTKINGSAMTQYGYVRSGIGVRVGDDPGRCLLVLDTTYASALSGELSRLVNDLRNEGMLVTRIPVGRNTSVEEIKATINSVYEKDPDHVSTVFLFGHVPVPYSGFMNPDGHPNHYGAWPADVYYGDDDLIDWTDDNYEDSIQNGTRVRDAQYNIASDGKYDQVQTPSELVLKIGRVDLSNMPSFSKSEKDLLKQYLDKDHAYRTGALSAPERGLIDDNFGYMSGEAFAASGWRNFAPLVGADSIHAVDFFTTLATDNYLWAYGCGGGWDQGASGVGATTDFASKPVNAIFTMLFGSYFGDWNVSDNFLRAPLCNDHSLVCAWSGRPYWLFFPMGLGHTTGDCALLTQNNVSDFDANIISAGAVAWQVHEALMGDPTLRMRPFVAPNSLTLSEDHAANSVTLVWPQDAALRGYNVYRASVRSNHMTLLTPQPIAAGTFTDASPLADTAYYLVRGVRDESTKSGNYLNLAYGASAVSNGGFNDAGVSSHQLSDNISVIYPEAGTVATIVLEHANSARVRIEVLDVQGRVIATLADGVGAAGTSRCDWNFASVPNGVYFIRAVGEGMPVSTKIFVRKD